MWGFSKSLGLSLSTAWVQSAINLIFCCFLMRFVLDSLFGFRRPTVIKSYIQNTFMHNPQHSGEGEEFHCALKDVSDICSKQRSYRKSFAPLYDTLEEGWSMAPPYRSLSQGWDHVSQGWQRLVDVFGLIQDCSLCSRLTDLTQIHTHKSSQRNVNMQLLEQKLGFTRAMLLNFWILLETNILVLLLVLVLPSLINRCRTSGT